MKKIVRFLAIIGVAVNFVPSNVAPLQGQTEYDLLIQGGAHR
jgi:hypothetical protein